MDSMRILFFGSLSLVIANLLSVVPAFAKSPAFEQKELRCLAQNIYFEARGEPNGGQLAVALVTMHRVKSHHYPNTICKVVWQRKQFSWTHDGKSDRPRDHKAWIRARQIASFMYFKYYKLPKRVQKVLDITHGALNYYAPELANPYWAKLKVITREIGGHIFMSDSHRTIQRESS
jgi:spore germination cell wall hydrolase CwlJ-like protein